jgi:nicotinamidase/pyrazinamidase
MYVYKSYIEHPPNPSSFLSSCFGTTTTNSNSKTKHTLALLLIDPQNDFVASNGSLSVPGAEDDAKRVADSLLKNLNNVDGIFVTLDTHQRFHISLASFWENEKGEHPVPFTIITKENLDQGIWKASRPEFQNEAKMYVTKLEQKGKFKLTIWPDHCIFGTTGHSIYPTLLDATHAWEDQLDHATTYIMKGNNSLTEMYSAFSAEVPRPDDPNTSINREAIGDLLSYSRIVVAGQAKSHCVNFSVRDLVKIIPKDRIGDIWVCIDGTSPVKGMEDMAEQFEKDMKALGVKFVTCEEAFKLPSA